jgi:hypothetical protein
VPSESERLHRRVGRRDRWFVGIVALATAVGTPLAIVLVGHGSAAPAGCVRTLEPGFMGGQTGTYCGKRAAAVCRARADADASLAAQCRRLRP